MTTTRRRSAAPRCAAFLATLGALALANAARADDPALFVNLADAPDSLWSTELDDPGGAAEVLQLPAEFVRGLVLDGPRSGWFVASFTEVGGPLGVYRFVGGAITKLSNFPLAPTGSLADATMAPGGDFFYYVFDPKGIKGDTLYRVDFDGSFTELAELVDPNEPDPLVSAIAVHPTTGVLYGYESHKKTRLVTIDPATGVLTTVGPTGLPPYPDRVMMGMDFTPAGELILVENFGILYRLDVATGQASTPFAQLLWPTAALAFLPGGDVGASYCQSTPNSSGFPARIAGAGSASVAANDLVLRAESVPAGAPGLFLYGRTPAQAPFGNGTLCLDPAGGAYRLPVAVADPAGVLEHALDNTDPPLAAGQITVGSTWYFQAIFRDNAAGGARFDLSDGLEVTFVP